MIADREDLDKYRAEYNISDSLITKLSSTQILIPGLIDTHIHAPQYPNIGIGLDKQLLEWLQAYTYPMEMKFNDSDFARKVYYAVVVSFLPTHLHLNVYWNFKVYSNTNFIFIQISRQVPPSIIQTPKPVFIQYLPLSLHPRSTENPQPSPSSSKSYL